MKRALVCIFLSFGMSYASSSPVCTEVLSLTEFDKNLPPDTKKDTQKYSEEDNQVPPVHAFRCPSCLG